MFVPGSPAVLDTDREGVPFLAVAVVTADAARCSLASPFRSTEYFPVMGKVRALAHAASHA